MGVEISLWEEAILKGKGMPRQVRRHFDVRCAKETELIEVLFELWIRVGPRKHVLAGGPDPLCEGVIF